MSELEDKAVDILDKLEAVLTTYTPEVAEVALAAVRISAISDLVYGVAGLVMLIPGFYVSKCVLGIFARKKADRPQDDWGMASVFYTVFVGFFGFVFFVDGVCTLIDVWLWVGLINPEVALAHKITGL